MPKKMSFNLWYAVIALMAILTLQGVLSQANRIEQIPYSQFQTYLESDRIEEIRVGENRIQGKLKNPQAGETPYFVTTRVDEALAQTLSSHNVRFAGEIENTWLRDLLSWVVPVLLFAGLWVFLMRRFAQ